MSTKRKKIYSKLDIAEAKKTSEEVVEAFSKKTRRRKTVQIRISKEWHSKLKEIAKSEDMLLSFMLDKICEHFFRHYS